MTVVYTDIYEQFNKPRVDKIAYSSDYTGDAITSGTLEKDVRYTFTSIGSGANFNNLGSLITASLVVGQYFYATSSASPTAWGGAELYDYMSPSDIITNEIANTRVKFQAIAEYCGTTFSEDDFEVALAVKYFTMYLLYLRSQSEEQGDAEYKMAISILTEQWGNSVLDFLGGITQEDGGVEVKQISSEKAVDVTIPDWEDDLLEDYV